MDWLKKLSLSVKMLVMFVIITLFCAGVALVTGQQILRMSANDPQIQIAWDTAAKLGLGADVKTLAPIEPVMISSNLSPFVIIYDSNYGAVAGNAIYKGALPNVPRGVLQYASVHGGDRVTWQPDSATRIALVVQKAPNNKGFVAVGRSLREVEVRESNLFYLITIAWIVSLLIGSAAALILFAEVRKRNSKKPAAVSQS